MSAPDVEPVVHGSVRALRTFRLLPEGVLAPVTGRAAWGSGVNTATCERRLGDHHRAPERGCSCGLWAFGDLQALRESDLREQDEVVAVIRCHGRVIPATLGLRAEHAALEAVWLAPSVPGPVRARLGAAYPQAAVYRSIPAMLAEHPLSSLPSYRLPTVPRSLPVHLQLAATVLWWWAVIGWLLVLLPAQRPAGAPPSLLEPVALGTPLLIAALTAGLMTRPSRWPWGLVALAVQSALALASVLVLDRWVAFEQISVLAGAAGTLHVLIAFRAWRLRLGRPGRIGRPRRR